MFFPSYTGSLIVSSPVNNFFFLIFFGQVNVYVLGKTYLKLSQELHIKVPAIGEQSRISLQICMECHQLEYPSVPNIARHVFTI